MRLTPAPLFLLPLLLTVSALQAAPATPAPLRIGLDHSYRHSTSLLIGSERPFVLLDPLTNKTLFSAAGGTEYRVTVSAAGIALAKRVGASESAVPGRFAAVLLVPGAGGFCRIARVGGKAEETHRYRGTLTVRRDTDGNLRVINTVALEPYLYGVIPAEIGTKVRTLVPISAGITPYRYGSRATVLITRRFPSVSRRTVSVPR